MQHCQLENRRRRGLNRQFRRQPQSNTDFSKAFAQTHDPDGRNVLCFLSAFDFYARGLCRLFSDNSQFGLIIAVEIEAIVPPLEGEFTEDDARVEGPAGIGDCHA